jgi:hypothetical protein
MYNSQNTNQVLGYMCSPKKSIEGFQNADPKLINELNNRLAAMTAERTQMENQQKDFQRSGDQQNVQNINNYLQQFAIKITDVEKQLALATGKPITSAPASMSGPAPGNNANTQKLAMFNSDPQVKQMMDNLNREIANRKQNITQQITQYNSTIDTMVRDFNMMSASYTTHEILSRVRDTLIKS